ncbi:MAG TPA: hypothetical protein VFD92_25725 [Candidatus Binatia bacterium]|nr:hypothetical protein [Candidatus Binatia bacterium]
MGEGIDSKRRMQVIVERIALAAIATAAIVALSLEAARGLTTEEVLKLREAGVSDETIQKMIDQEAANPSGVPQQMVDQEYASRHIGSWNLPDGSVVLSTGKSREPGFDPTLPQNNQYPISVYPYVFPGGGMPGPPGPMGPMGGGAPVIAPR